MNQDDKLLTDWREKALALEAEVSRAVIGQPQVLRLLNTSVFARGHVLLQGDVGVGKTTLLRAFSQVLGGAFARVEGSVDLMPNDLLYYTYINEAGRPAVEPGPLISQGEELAIFLFNEINRARPQVHALMLRAMAERSVQAFNRTYTLPHLLVFADRNRVEREETFEISTAARDRFMMEITIEAPSADAERRALVFDPRFHDTERLVASLAPAMLDHRRLNDISQAVQRNLRTSDALMAYALALWRATAAPAEFGVRLSDIETERLVLAGASPRGMSLMLRAARTSAWLDGRDFVTPEDLQAVFTPTLSHRLVYQPVFEMQRHEIAPLLMPAILAAVAAP